MCCNDVVCHIMQLNGEGKQCTRVSCCHVLSFIHLFQVSVTKLLRTHERRFIVLNPIDLPLKIKEKKSFFFFLKFKSFCCDIISMHPSNLLLFHQCGYKPRKTAHTPFSRASSFLWDPNPDKITFRLCFLLCSP